MQEPRDTHGGGAAEDVRALEAVVHAVFAVTFLSVGWLMSDDAGWTQWLSPLLVGGGVAGIGLTARALLRSRPRGDEPLDPRPGKVELYVVVAGLGTMFLTAGATLLFLSYDPTAIGLDASSVPLLVGVVTSVFGLGLIATGVAAFVQIALRALGRRASLFDDLGG